MREKGRDSRPLSALLSLPRRSGNRRGRADPIARQLRCKGLEGGYVLDGTRPCTKVSRKREPSPLTSRARTHAPACLSQSPRSMKGRLTEHRDPVARRTPGSEERVRRSAAAPARKCYERVQVGIMGRASRKRHPVRTVGCLGEGGSSDRVPHVGPYGTLNHAERGSCACDRCGRPPMEARSALSPSTHPLDVWGGSGAFNPLRVT